MRPLPATVARALAEEGRGLRILVVRLAALGDLLRTLPAVRLLRRGLPRAHIAWVVDDRWQAGLAGHPDVDRLLPLPRAEWRRLARSPGGWTRLAPSIAGFVRSLRSARPELVLDFHGNLRSGLVGLLSGASVRVGHGGHQQREGNRWLTTHRVAAGSRRTSRIERNLQLLRALGLPSEPLPPGDLPLVRQGRRAADEAARAAGADGLLAIVSPSASRAQAHKKPPAELLAAACRTLADGGLAPLVVWGPGEQDDARRVVEASGGRGLLAPPTDLAALAALTARARLFVGGDSGPLHLACAVGCPVVGLYGPTDPAVNAPWGVPFRALWPPGRRYTGIKRRDRVRGFEGLTGAQVAAAIGELLGTDDDGRR